ncbi:MAG: hypothetical protein K2Y40_16665 [Reyranella sp.]|jgi:hypothetical protein|nr:hypothetical protein [Reyranella sp.]
MLQQLKARFFPGRIAARPTLRRFVSGEASYLAQRATYEFSRNTLAWHGQHVLGDAKFNEVFAVCRWESFAAIAADMTFLVRAHLAGGPSLDAPLLQVYAEVLGEYPNPVHRPDGWGDCLASLLARFGGIPDGRAPDLKAMGYKTGRLIYGKAPVTANNIEEESAVLGAAVTFGLISFNDRLPRRLDTEALIKDLPSRQA